LKELKDFVAKGEKFINNRLLTVAVDLPGLGYVNYTYHQYFVCNI